jgi:hypothetical protein
MEFNLMEGCLIFTPIVPAGTIFISISSNFQIINPEVFDLAVYREIDHFETVEITIFRQLKLLI